MISILAIANLIPSIRGAFHVYEDIDCTGPFVTFSEDSGCVDLTKVMSSQVKGSDHGWHIYPTTDCSGPISFLAPPQAPNDKTCISDNQSYRFIAQSARSDK
jgi:Cu/Zn superoxide dismutase